MSTTAVSNHEVTTETPLSAAPGQGSAPETPQQQVLCQQPSYPQDPIYQFTQPQYSGYMLTRPYNECMEHFPSEQNTQSEQTQPVGLQVQHPPPYAPYYVPGGAPFMCNAPNSGQHIVPDHVFMLQPQHQEFYSEQLQFNKEQITPDSNDGSSSLERRQRSSLSASSTAVTTVSASGQMSPVTLVPHFVRYDPVPSPSGVIPPPSHVAGQKVLSQPTNCINLNNSNLTVSIHQHLAPPVYTQSNIVPPPMPPSVITPNCFSGMVSAISYPNNSSGQVIGYHPMQHPFVQHHGYFGGSGHEAHLTRGQYQHPRGPAHHYSGYNEDSKSSRERGSSDRGGGRRSSSSSVGRGGPRNNGASSGGLQRGVRRADSGEVRNERYNNSEHHPERNYSNVPGHLPAQMYFSLPRPVHKLEGHPIIAQVPDLHQQPEHLSYLPHANFQAAHSEMPTNMLPHHFVHPPHVNYMIPQHGVEPNLIAAGYSYVHEPMSAAESDSAIGSPAEDFSATPTNELSDQHMLADCTALESGLAEFRDVEVNNHVNAESHCNSPPTMVTVSHNDATRQSPVAVHAYNETCVPQAASHEMINYVYSNVTVNCSHSSSNVVSPEPDADCSHPVPSLRDERVLVDTMLDNVLCHDFQFSFGDLTLDEFYEKARSQPMNVVASSEEIKFVCKRDHVLRTKREPIFDSEREFTTCSSIFAAEELIMSNVSALQMYSGNVAFDTASTACEPVANPQTNYVVTIPQSLYVSTHQMRAVTNSYNVANSNSDLTVQSCITAQAVTSSFVTAAKDVFVVRPALESNIVAVPVAQDPIVSTIAYNAEHKTAQSLVAVADETLVVDANVATAPEVAETTLPSELQSNNVATTTTEKSMCATLDVSSVENHTVKNITAIVPDTRVEKKHPEVLPALPQKLQSSDFPALGETVTQAAGAWGRNKNWKEQFKRGSNQVAVVTPFGASSTSDAVSNKVSGSSNHAKTLDSKKTDEDDIAVQAVKSKIGEFLLSYEPDGTSYNYQPRGLNNKNLYCYANSVIQALFAVPQFANLLYQLESRFGDLITADMMPITHCVVSYLKQLLPLNPNFASSGNIKMRNNRKNASHSATNLPDLSDNNPLEPMLILEPLIAGGCLCDGQQHDSIELLTFLLNRLHEELLSCQKKAAENKLPEQYSELPNGQADDCEQDWITKGPKNKSCITRASGFVHSPLSKVFWGEYRHVIHRNNFLSSANLQVFTSLELFIGDEEVTSVQQALAQYVRKDELTVMVNGENVPANGQHLLEELPQVLVLQLKRFTYALDSCQKVMKDIHVPVDLDISKDFLYQSSRKKFQGSKGRYKLISVVCHDGVEAYKGHYVSYVFHSGYCCWVYFDDANIKAITPGDFQRMLYTKSPYILFYRREDTFTNDTCFPLNAQPPVVIGKKKKRSDSGESKESEGGRRGKTGGKSVEAGDKNASDVATVAEKKTSKKESKKPGSKKHSSKN